LRLKVHGNDLRCSGTGTKLSFHVKKLLSTRIPKWIPSGLSGHLEFGPSRWKWLHVDLIYACFFVGSVCEPVSIGREAGVRGVCGDEGLRFLISAGRQHRKSPQPTT